MGGGGAQGWNVTSTQGPGVGVCLELWAASMRHKLKEETLVLARLADPSPSSAPGGIKTRKPQRESRAPTDGVEPLAARIHLSIILVPKCLKAVCTFCQVGTILFLTNTRMLGQEGMAARDGGCRDVPKVP